MNDFNTPTNGASVETQAKPGDMIDNTKATIRRQVEQQSAMAGERLTEVGRDLEDVSSQLRARGRDVAATAVDFAVQRLTMFGDYLKQANLDVVVKDVNSFARRQPVAVYASALVLGVVAARMIKIAANGSAESQTSSWSDQQFTQEANR